MAESNIFRDDYFWLSCRQLCTLCNCWLFLQPEVGSMNVTDAMDDDAHRTHVAIHLTLKQIVSVTKDTLEMELRAKVSVSRS